MKILHLDTNHPLLIEQLSLAGFSNDLDNTSSKSEIEAKIGSYDGIVIRSRFPIDKDFLKKAVNLKFIARVGAGLENIDTDYATKKNIALIAAPEGNRNAVGEHTLGLILSLFNKLNAADREIRAGYWNREQNRGHELDGKIIGIIGYGNMGKAFARKLRGFDVEVICHDILENVGDQNAKQVPLQEIFEKADVVSLHVPFTNLTHKMVDSDFIGSFAKPFWLINTSRGKNVVTADVVDGLKSGKILGAGLDVLEFEKSSFENMFDNAGIPPEFDYLLQSENVLLSPHVAGWTVESNIKLAQVIVDKIKALIFPEAREAVFRGKVTGIGGFFFKSDNSKALVSWYQKHLKLDTDEYGCTFWWKDKYGDDCSTQWSPFAATTDYFAPSEKQFMQNFRVDDLDALLARLDTEGIKQIGVPQSFDYGKFAWIIDPEGNKIELWQPNDRAFR